MRGATRAARTAPRPAPAHRPRQQFRQHLGFLAGARVLRAVVTLAELGCRGPVTSAPGRSSCGPARRCGTRTTGPPARAVARVRPAGLARVCWPLLAVPCGFCGVAGRWVRAQWRRPEPPRRDRAARRPPHGCWRCPGWHCGAWPSAQRSREAAGSAARHRGPASRAARSTRRAAAPRRDGCSRGCRQRPMPGWPGSGLTARRRAGRRGGLRRLRPAAGAAGTRPCRGRRRTASSAAASGAACGSLRLPRLAAACPPGGAWGTAAGHARRRGVAHGMAFPDPVRVRGSELMCRQLLIAIYYPASPVRPVRRDRHGRTPSGPATRLCHCRRVIYVYRGWEARPA